YPVPRRPLLARSGQTMPRWSGLPKPAPQRRRADLRGFLHDHKPSPLKMLNKPLSDDLGHDLVRVVDALPALEAQREGDRIGEVGRVGGRELVGVGHAGRIASGRERNKNNYAFRPSPTGTRMSASGASGAVRHRPLSESTLSFVVRIVSGGFAQS